MVPGGAAIRFPLEPTKVAPPPKLRVPILPPYTITQVPSSVIVEPRETGPALRALTSVEI